MNEYSSLYPADTRVPTGYFLMGKLKAPATISLDVTTKCNLRCIHCYNNSGDVDSDTDMSDEELYEVAREIAEIHPVSMCLCGGEPLMRNNLFEIAELLGKNVGALNMVSNGYAMSEDIVSRLSKCNFYMIQISLDGLNSYQHDSFRGVKGSFEKAVNAISLLAKYKIPQRATSFVPNLLNYKSFHEYVSLCVKLKVNTVRVMPFIPSGRGETIGKNLILDSERMFRFQRDLVIASNDFKDSITIEWGDPLDHLRRLPYNAFNDISTYTLEIKSNGDVTATTYLPLVLGNIKKHSIQEIWDNGYNFLWRNPELLKYTEKIQNIFDFESFEPAPYSGEKVYIDLLK